MQTTNNTNQKIHFHHKEIPFRDSRCGSILGKRVIGGEL